MANDDAVRFAPVILAGGSGTRFWPRSRRARAKQVLALDGDETMIQQTLARLLPVAKAEDVWVVTNGWLDQTISAQMPTVKTEHILSEPAARNTAPACALTAFLLAKTDSPMAATVMDLLSAVKPKAALFLGKCGGLKKTKLGDLVLPIAAIRGDGTSDDYLPKEIPALPSFRLQRAVSSMIKKHELDYYTGTVYTTNRRVWEHDQEFKDYLRRVRALAVDMETATIFVVGFMNDIPHGALLLVSDNPMTPEGVKTSESDSKVTNNFVKQHLTIGIESLLELKNSGESVKHMKFE